MAFPDLTKHLPVATRMSSTAFLAYLNSKTEKELQNFLKRIDGGVLKNGECEDVKEKLVKMLIKVVAKTERDRLREVIVFKFCLT